MPDYRIYVVDDEGHFFRSIAVADCPDDETALDTAKQVIDGHDVEVWQRGRKVAVLDHRTKSIKSS